MQKNALFALALAACLTLSGCAAPSSDAGAASRTVSAPAQSSVQNSVQSTQSADTAPAGPLRLLQGFGGVPLGGFGPDGLYFVTPWARADGSFNLWYADYASRQILPLCAAPGCPHDSDSCTSYIPLSPGGALPEVVGETLVLFFPGQPGGGSDASALPRLEVMGLDGSDRREALRFAANQTVERPMATDGSVIYARLNTYLEETTEAELVCIDPVKGTCRTVCPLSVEQNEWVWGCVGSSLILYRTGETGGYELVRLDLATLERETVYQWAEDQPYPSLFGSTLVYENQQDRRFHLLDLATGQDTALSGYTLPEPGGSTQATVYDCDAGCLLFEERVFAPGTGTLEQERFYTLSADGSAPKEWTLTYSYLGETTAASRVTDLDQDHYLIILSQQDVSLPQTGADGTTYYVPGTKPQYAAISKADYWAGTPSAEPFGDWGL
ncbi:hypothetical protein [uncultured Allofournierella sp.]|uniref:hypothetical protein n=1 Tax=uncultured Allofournierella sp. TaxID=1940258 RepID=UPI0025D2BB89|nr:hypothetical protein [uncultured Fournierella sp.]